MNCLKYTKPNFAAGILSMLAAILITACEPGLTQTPAISLEGTPATATSLPASPAAPTPTTAPDTPTATRTPTRPSATISATVMSETGSPTPEPTEEAAVTPEGTGPAQMKLYETTVTLPTYPIWDYLVEQVDSRYNISAFYFNRLEYEAAAPTPTPTDYTAVVLENPYLRLTFLPELGGRLYSAVVKKTGQEIFYQNRVVKPSRYGVLQPPEANWWLATGGMEWAYPTQEHGYRWGVPWDYRVTRSAKGATITLSDTAPDRVGVEVSVTLPANSAAFTVAPKLVNAGSETAPVQFWLNAALTLAPETMSNRTRFIVPVDQVVVHSRGEEGWTVPGPLQKSPWPQVGDTNLSNYRQWAIYLGFFVPHMDAPFIGAYNPQTDLGVVRLIEPGQVPGNKLFAFGRSFPDRSYTDNNSQYFELWGGANTGFWAEDDLDLPPGGSLEWQEQWWPLAGLGGLTWANQEVAIFLAHGTDAHRLSISLSHPRQGELTILAGEESLLSESFSARPNEPLQWTLPASDGPIRIQITDQRGRTLLDYCPDFKPMTAF